MCKKYVVNKLFLGSRELGYELWDSKQVVEATSKAIYNSIKTGDEIYGLAIGANGELGLDKGYFMTNMMEKRHIGNLKPMIESEENRVNIFYLVTGSRKEGNVTYYEMISSRFERLDVTKEKLSLMYEMGLINGGVKIVDGGTVVLPQMEKKEPPEKKETVTEEKEKTEETKKTEEKAAEAEKETAKNKETAAMEKKVGSALTTKKEK